MLVGEWVSLSVSEGKAILETLRIQNVDICIEQMTESIDRGEISWNVYMSYEKKQNI